MREGFGIPLESILVDRARRVRSEKHGGSLGRQPLDGVDKALDRLAERDEAAQWQQE
ncbi:MAG: hypothetical protein GY711_23200 [bacterium]|nr:hypothetical protein [bacterium]